MTAADLIPISLICKVSSVEGRPAVKLSDNYAKALGLPWKSSATAASSGPPEWRTLQCSRRPLS